MAHNRHIDEMRALRLYENEMSPASVAAAFGIAAAEVLDFSLNVNPFGPPPRSLAAAHAALGHSNHYPDLRLPSLRQRLARRHGVPEDHFFFGAGLDDVLKLILQAWVSEGDRVLVHLPTFPRYELEARLRGAVVAAVRSDPVWSIDVAAIRRRLAAEAIALAFLCSPNNPTGATIPPGEVERLVADFPDTLFVLDEALIEPSEAGAVALIGAHRHLVVLRTFSKHFGLAGFRVGYAIADPALLALAEVVRPPFNVALAAAAAAEAALDDAEFLQRTQAIFRAEAEFVAAALARLGGTRLRGRYGNMLFLELVDTGIAAFLPALARRGILVADGTSFRGLEHTETVRISLRDRAGNERLLAAIEAALPRRGDRSG